MKCLLWQQGQSLLGENRVIWERWIKAGNISHCGDSLRAAPQSRRPSPGGQRRGWSCLKSGPAKRPLSFSPGSKWANRRVMTLGRREDVGQMFSLGAKGDQEHKLWMEYFSYCPSQAKQSFWFQFSPAQLPYQAGVSCPDSCPDKGR